NTSVATAVPASTPGTRATKCPTPRSPAGMRAVDVRSPSTPRSSSSARRTAWRMAPTGGSKSPLTASPFPLRHRRGRRDPHPPARPEVDDALQGLAGLGEVEPAVASPGLVALGRRRHDGAGHAHERPELGGVAP